jgi:hypothetical protein
VHARREAINNLKIEMQQFGPPPDDDSSTTLGPVAEREFSSEELLRIKIFLLEQGSRTPKSDAALSELYQELEVTRRISRALRVLLNELVPGSTPPVARGPHDAESALASPLIEAGTPIVKDTPAESTFVAVTIAPLGDEEMSSIAVATGCRANDEALQAKGTRPVGPMTTDKGEAGSPRPAAVPVAPATHHGHQPLFHDI